MKNNDIDAICEILQNSGIAILPSDTLYGIAANAYDEEAIKKVFEIKGRSFDKKLPVHYHSLESMEKDVELNDAARILIQKFTPGMLTIVAKKKADSTLQFTAETVAVRIPGHPTLLEIIKQVGPITMPSANKSGIEPKLKLADIQKDLNIPGLEDDSSIKGTASTIFDTINNKIIREGAISKDQINQALAILNINI